MFEHLSNKISKSIRNVMGIKRITENDIKKTLDEVRVSLLEGDVALPVVHNFINQVKKNMIGKNVNRYLTPGQELVKIIYSSLLKIISKGSNALNLSDQIPNILLIVGPQGSGKTTTVGKLAKFLNHKKNKKILVTSTDIYRPAGLKQLQALVFHEKNINFFSECVIDNSIDMVKNALIFAKLQHYDILIIDTPGCLDTEYNLLSELAKIYEIANPIETLFVVDSMVGQVIVNIIKTFDKYVPLTGVILTKLDGDARGGAALSITYITEKPIKFIGIGEQINELEPFYPDRIASRILGMGDITSLIEDIERQVKSQKQKEYIKKSNTDFNLYDFLNHIKQIRNMGGVNKIISKLPNFGININNLESDLCSNKLLHIEAIINSMTAKERMYPNIIQRSRKKRIAIGSGTSVQDVTNLLDKFNDMRILMQKMNKNSIFKAFSMLQNKISSKF